MSGARTNTMRAQIALRERILSGEITPGTRLFEVPMAEALEMSRTPVREAMSRLAEEGLLDRVPTGGFLVRSFGLADVRDSIELRGTLEGMAARFAAERGAPAEALEEAGRVLAELDAAFAGGPEALDLGDYARLNTAFHAGLAAMSGSEVVQRELARVTSLPFASPEAFLHDTSRDVEFRRSLLVAQDQHRRLLQAIAARQAGRAEHIAREHAGMARRNLETTLSEDPAALGSVPGLSMLRD